MSASIAEPVRAGIVRSSVGNRLKLHTVPAFISIVGGLILFGASGLLLGPLAVTATIFSWRFGEYESRRASR